MAQTSSEPNKRERLITAAVTSFHKIGYAQTALAEVAKVATVPLGNVYYYFKTKAELATAVVEAWQSRSEAIFNELDEVEDPWKRLQGMLQRAKLAQALYTEFGCPLANLARDLRAAPEAALPPLANTVYQGVYRWVEAQFRQIGYKKTAATAHSRFFVAGLQGAILMAHVHHDESFITEQVTQLRRWLKSLHEAKS